MKLQHLAIGDRFEFHGKIFVKTGPVTASSEEGGQQMIPRYAVLKPIDVPTRDDDKPGLRRKVEEKKVLAAFDDFYRTCSELLDASALPALAEARERFLGRLK
ncbi:hypothetical protein LZ012_10940 [Dechloromonas sp. XY25]|uniref:Uncharacterized protein n=1 Tax=Dechloromonas hankyongensis TaxID=2908002 RepID=A0ABS9K2Y5_9RHOO|nr:hypothetical protein [Dechloromonas hankyongensis]MCG2577510.1 hypothetical protein [Dechloromonas hankyongensis]